MGTMGDLEAVLSEAHRHAAAGRWGEAGRGYVEGAERALALGGEQPARRALEAAGEAFRRADAPRLAATALHRALALPCEDPAERAVALARLAAVLSTLGNGPGAREVCHRALALPGAPAPLTVAATDTLLGVELTFGRADAARALLPRLAAAPVALAFRSGQLQRLAGDLEQAVHTFAGVVSMLDGQPGGEAGVAAARCEIGETQVLAGAAADAVDTFADAVELHRRTGRLALAWAAEASCTRARVEGGAVPLPGGLDQGIAWADAHGLVLLAIDLRIARGMALARADAVRALYDLTRAREAADDVGARLRAGRARYELLLRCAPSDSGTLRREAAALLADSAPWTERLARLA